MDMLDGVYVWIWNLARCDGGDYDRIAARLREAGARGVIVKAADGGRPFPQRNGAGPQPVARIVAELRGRGLTVGTWDYCYGSDPGARYYDYTVAGLDAECERAVETINTARPDFHVLDVEQEWEEQPDAASRATRLLERLRAAIPADFPLGYAPLPAIRYHLRLPYRQFTDAGCAMLPQLYWTGLRWSPSRTCDVFYGDAERYDLLGQAVCPAYQDSPGAAPDDEEHAEFLRLVAARGGRGVSVWSYEHLDAAGWARVAAAARAFPHDAERTVERASRFLLPDADGLFPRDPATGWLLPAAGPLTAGFGATEEPRDSSALYLGRRYAHFNKGIDIGCAEGTAVHTVTDGTVIVAGESGDGWDTAVKLVDGDGVTHNYGHLAAVAVGPGDQVTRGQVIGRSGRGDPAHSTGPHLSYDVYRRTTAGTAWIDPSLYLHGPDALVPGLAARVVNAAGANLRAAPDLAAPVLGELEDGAVLGVRGRALYPLAWRAGAALIWSGWYTLDRAARPMEAAAGTALPRPAATVEVITHPAWGSRLLRHVEGDAWAAAGIAAGGDLRLALPEWYPVQADGRRGWVHAALLRFEASEPDGRQASNVVPGVRLLVTEDDLRFRSAPEFGENVLAHAAAGTVVALRREAYLPVAFHGGEGWVWAALLDMAAVGDAPAPGLVCTVAAGHTPNVRALPDEGSALLGQAGAGTRLTLRAQAFYPVRWEGRDGWMWGGYLRGEEEDGFGQDELPVR